MKTIQFESEVGDDGVLSLQVPLGTVGANTRVIVTIEPLPTPEEGQEVKQADWRAFVERTYGSCADLGLEEPGDLPLQPRDWEE